MVLEFDIYTDTRFEIELSDSVDRRNLLDFLRRTCPTLRVVYIKTKQGESEWRYSETHGWVTKDLSVWNAPLSQDTIPLSNHPPMDSEELRAVWDTAKPERIPQTASEMGEWRE